MNRSAIDELAGIKPVAESTMTTSMPSMPAAATTIPTAGPQKKKVKLSNLLLKKKLRQEGGEKPVIPDDAKPDETAALSAQTPAQTAPNGGTIEDPLPTSIALVAPDTTPNAETPLDPVQVPQPASSPEVKQSSPTPTDNEQDVLRTLIGSHQENFNPKLITDPTAAVAAVTAALNGQGSQSDAADPAAAKAALKAAEVMNEAQSGKQTEYKHNPESMNRAIAVTRQFI